MAISGSGLYFLTVEKILIDTAGQSLEAEDNNLHLVNDSYTPAYDTHDFHADLTNEISGGNYAAEAVTGTEITVSSGTLTWDWSDVVFDNGGSNDVTISNAMAGVYVTSVSGTATDQLVGLWDYVTAASCSNSTFTHQVHTSGALTIDLVP